MMSDSANRVRRHLPLVLLLALIAPGAFAEAPSGDVALSRTFDDARLQWGPCPEFMPKGCGIAALHGDPAKPNADVFFRVPAGSKIPAHWHTSPERMILVSGELHVTYEGQPTAILKPGMYAYGPSKAVHTGSCASASPCVLFIAFESPVDAVAVEQPKK